MSQLSSTITLSIKVKSALVIDATARILFNNLKNLLYLSSINLIELCLIP